MPWDAFSTRRSVFENTVPGHSSDTFFESLIMFPPKNVQGHYFETFPISRTPQTLEGTADHGTNTVMLLSLERAEFQETIRSAKVMQKLRFPTFDEFEKVTDRFFLKLEQ